MSDAALLSIRDLSVVFRTEDGPLAAVRGLDLDVAPGELCALVGESGSGKSMTALAVMDLVPRPAGTVRSRSMRFAGRELSSLPAPERARLRGGSISMVFQDALSALHPLLTIERQLTEVLERHAGLDRRAARKEAAQALGDVGIPGPERVLDRYPHQLSGGQRQRVMIAMALVCRPALVFADEPTTALDVTLQAQVLDLLDRLRRQHGSAVVLITHDLGIVARHAERVAVLYAGSLVEDGPTESLFARPSHPYTRGLLACVPRLDSDPDTPLATLPGHPPRPGSLPPGCAFAPRCSLAHAACEDEPPSLASPSPGSETGSGTGSGTGSSTGHRSACLERAALFAEGRP